MEENQLKLSLSDWLAFERTRLANERTFLAFITTGLALVSVGVGLESLALNLQPGLRLAASILLVIGGGITPIEAWIGWARVETALREGRPLSPSRLILLLSVILGAAAVLILLALLIR